MLLTKLDNISEQTINKIAEMAFKSQIKDAQHLCVKVETNPHKLAKGVLESICIDGYGLKMQKNLCLEQMTINLNEIAVNPFKALMGNVQLTQPSYGKACIVLSEADIETALNVDNLNQKLELNKYQILLNNQPLTAEFTRVDCRILEDGRVAVKAKLKMGETDSSESICLIFKPVVCTQGRGIILDEVECTQGKDLSPILTDALIEEARQIFNLDNFLKDAISLNVNHLSVEEGKVNLLASAGMTHLPTR